MNFISLKKRLESSQQFKTFKSQHPNAELVAGFFILDFKDKREEATLDYKQQEDLFTFNMQDPNFAVKKEEVLDKTKPLEKLNTDIKVDIQDLEQIIKAQLEEQEIKQPIEKIIAVISQSSNPKENFPIFNLTIMLSSFVILLCKINAQSGEVLEFKKKSLFDFVKPQSPK